MPMTSQQLASIARQVGAVLVSVYGVLTASWSPLHLPPAVSAVLVSFAPIVLIVQHYVANPTTGTSVVTTPTAQKQTAPVLPQLVTQVTPDSSYISPTPIVTYTPPGGPTVVAPGQPGVPVVVPNPAPPTPGVVQ